MPRSERYSSGTILSELPSTPPPAVLASEAPVEQAVPNPAGQEIQEQPPSETTTQASNRFMRFLDHVPYPCKEWPYTTGMAFANGVYAFSIFGLTAAGEEPKANDVLAGTVIFSSLAGSISAFAGSIWSARNIDNENSKLRLNERLQRGGTIQTSNNFLKDNWRTLATVGAYSVLTISEKFAVEAFYNKDIGKGVGLSFLAIAASGSNLVMAATAEKQRKELWGGRRRDPVGV